MNVKNVKDLEYFTSVDGCRIAETFGLPSENIKDASIAYAILKPGKSTEPHCHDFLEWYIIIKGNAEMTIDKEKRTVIEGDHSPPYREGEYTLAKRRYIARDDR